MYHEACNPHKLTPEQQNQLIKAFQQMGVARSILREYLFPMNPDAPIPPPGDDLNAPVVT